MSNREIIEKFNNDIIIKSWTYEKLTNKEKENWKNTIFDSPMVEKALKGTEFQKFHILNTIYHAFLKGCGYDSFNWRCTEEEKEIM
jgi:hypothetical protein